MKIIGSATISKWEIMCNSSRFRGYHDGGKYQVGEHLLHTGAAVVVTGGVLELIYTFIKMIAQ